MAFDGITTACVVRELSEKLTGGVISRIVQPEKDELQLLIRNRRDQYILHISADASLPLIYLADRKKEAPMTAPNFCMLLRKHLQNGVIEDVSQPGLERVVIFRVMHRDELGDLAPKQLVLELMGKHSNLILTDGSCTVLDSIKRVPASMSSVREVLPGRPWFIPETRHKADPLALDAASFAAALAENSQDLAHALSGSFTGISLPAAEEFLFEADADPRKSYRDLTEGEAARLSEVFLSHMAAVREGRFECSIASKDGVPAEFAAFPLRMYSGGEYQVARFDSPSEMIVRYYGDREKITRMRQKSSDLRRVVQTALDRTNKKFLIQQKQLQSTEKMDQYRIRGELLNTFGYEAEPGAKEFTCVSYYTNEPVKIPLDPTLTAIENAQKYFARYNKLKRTAEAVTEQIAETEGDREQLEAILSAIDLAESEADLTDIRRELAEYGFIQKKGPAPKGARKMPRSEPLSFISSDGFEILVGKNNFQNEELSFKIAENSDWWFHAKGAPGSHVILRCGGREVPDRSFEEAAALAAYYSSQRSASRVEIDYTLKRNLRKKNGGKPGFVIYHTNYSMMASTDISGIRRKG